MMLSGEKIESGNMVTRHRFSHQRQPAGFDLTVESVWAFEGAGAIDGDNSRRKLPPARKMEWETAARIGENPDGTPAPPFIHLASGGYKIIFNETVSVPADCAALARPRSSLLRMGATVFTALWDPGYTGRSEALLQVINPAGLTLYRDAKVVQLAFVRLEGGKAGQTYAGAYQNENATE